MAEQVRIGIIGCGGMGSVHAGAWQADPRAQIVAVTDSARSRAEALAARTGAQPYGDLERMLIEQRLDLVSVCTPPAGHLPAARQALQAGCHVLCEKPLARTATEAQQMVEAAGQAGRLLVTAFCHRFHQPVTQMREWIQAGKIGRVLQFRNRFAGWIPMEGKWFSDPDLAGGGAIIDTSIHSIDLFRYLVGDPTSVAACIATMVQAIAVEDSSLLLLQTAEGAIGSIEACWSSPVSESTIEVYGSEGTAFYNYSEPGARYRTREMPEWQQVPMTGPDRFVLQARHMLDCVLGIRQPLVSGEDGLWAARISDAAYQAARKQVCVQV